MTLTTWILRAEAGHSDRARTSFNLIVRAPTQEIAIGLAKVELETRGWSDVEMLRIGEVAESARERSEGALRRAIDAAYARGVGIVEYLGQAH